MTSEFSQDNDETRTAVFKFQACLVQRLPQLRVVDKRLDKVQTTLDGRQLQQRLLEPLGEEALPHGGLAPIQQTEQRLRLVRVGRRRKQVERAHRGLVEPHEAGHVERLELETHRAAAAAGRGRGRGRRGRVAAADRAEQVEVANQRRQTRERVCALKLTLVLLEASAEQTAQIRLDVLGVEVGCEWMHQIPLETNNNE